MITAGGGSADLSEIEQAISTLSSDISRGQSEKRNSKAQSDKKADQVGTEMSLPAAYEQRRATMAATVHSAGGTNTKAQTEALQKAIINAVYPVGAVYISVTSTSPASLFGGTWEQIQGRFLLGRSSSYKAGSTGGAATHTLTTSEIPSHNHLSVDAWTGVDIENAELMMHAKSDALFSDGYKSTGYAPATSGSRDLYRAANPDTIYTSETGGGQAHNNMPPYLVVYMWRRTA